MSAAAAANPVAVLRRAVLLAGLLAVIAGFLGMHILVGLPRPARPGVPSRQHQHVDGAHRRPGAL